MAGGGVEAVNEEAVWRRFGSRHENPCKRPEVLTCAMWECQYANQCQWSEKAGTQIDPRSHPEDWP